MHVSNVHHREIASPVARVGALIDSLAGDRDRLWPHERWPAMGFDQPGLIVGAAGGHGPIGYRVLSHERGRSAMFEFTNRPRGLHGRHGFVAQANGADSCVLWHVLDARITGALHVTWPVLWRPLHDALIEDALTKAKTIAEGRPDPNPPRWSGAVRSLREVGNRLGMSKAPAGSRPDEHGYLTLAQ